MFTNNLNLTGELDLSNWIFDITKATYDENGDLLTEEKANKYVNTRSLFSGCSGLMGAIPSGLFGTFDGAPAQSMFSNTFNGCTNLTSITFERNEAGSSDVRNIGNNAFENSGLKEIVIPNGVKSIGRNAFAL